MARRKKISPTLQECQKRTSRGPCSAKTPKLSLPGTSALYKIKRQDKSVQLRPAANNDGKNVSDTASSPHFTNVKVATSKKPLSALQEKLMTRLRGGRFRMLNEELYTNTGGNMFDKFQKDFSSFEEYHNGYRVQTRSWKRNPTDLIIAWLKKKAFSNLRIADLGCGDARIAATFPDRTIYSVDLVASDPERVISANMGDLPLSDNSVDIAIYCLSLMGTDWPTFLQEGTRILTAKGILKIAEIQSRLTDVDAFVRSVEAMGYQLIEKEDIDSYFYIFEFKKVKQLASVVPPPASLLSSCKYKKR